MAKKPTVKQNTGIFALAFCCAALIAGYTYYLVRTNQHLDVQAIALAPHWYQVKPLWVRQIVTEGGFTGTLAAVLLLMFQGLLYGSGVMVAGYYGLKHFLWKAPSRTESKASETIAGKGVYTAEIQGSELMVMLPKYSTPDGPRGGLVDKQPYQQNFYRIDQAEVPTKEGVEPTVYQQLYLAIYAMLKQHPDVPASVGGHHADASLLDHSMAVSKKVRDFYATQGKREPLAQIAGLAHDLDKLLAYKRSGDVWVKNVNATHHNKYAAHIVSTQNEFRLLPEDDRETLVLALRYYHDPENLPIGASNRTEALVLALRTCDGYTIQEEKVAGVSTLSDEQLEDIEKALLLTLAGLNVNQYLNTAENAGGWTTPALEFVIVPMSAVLEQMGQFLSVELNRKLQLDHETRTFRHPAAKLASQRFDKLGLLMTSYKTFVSPDGLYDCRIGTVSFNAVVMLQKQQLEKLSPGLQEKWGTAAYRIRIVKATEDKNAQDAGERTDVGAEAAKEA